MLDSRFNSVQNRFIKDPYNLGWSTESYILKKFALNIYCSSIKHLFSLKCILCHAYSFSLEKYTAEILASSIFCSKLMHLKILKVGFPYRKVFCDPTEVPKSCFYGLKIVLSCSSGLV
jgi:hypothetical protein